MNPTSIVSTKGLFAAGRLPHFTVTLDGGGADDTPDFILSAVPQALPAVERYLSVPVSPGYQAPEHPAPSLGLTLLVDEAPPLPEAAALSTVGTGSGALAQVLYLQEAGTASPISVTDINQGQMGDCYLLSSIGEIVLFHPSQIGQMIQANADGTETVTLWLAANGSLPTYGTTAYKADAITVTNTFPGNSVNNGASQDVLNGQKEIWVQVLEKAVATLYGSYNGIANGGIPSIAMEELTGCAASSTRAGGISLQQLQSDVAAGDLITFDTQNSSTLPYGLYGNHAYMFQSLSTVNGTVMVNLLNPWGVYNPSPIPFAQITTAFSQIDVGQAASHATGPALVLQTANQTWAQGSHVSLTLPAGLFSEPSGGKLTYTAAQTNGQACPSWLSFNATTLTFSGTVPAGMAALSLKVTATDASGLSCSDFFAVTVPAAPPTLAHQTAAQSWLEGAKLSFALPANTFADPNGQTLSYAASLSNGQALPSWLAINRASGTFTGSVGYTAGPMMIKVTAADTSGLSVSETFQATLVAPAPVLTDQTANQTWRAGTALTFRLASDTFSSVPGQTLTYAATLPSGLTMNATTGTISGTVPVTPGANTIRVTATETSGLSVSETFVATVVASAPAVTQTPAQVWTAHQPISFSLPANSFIDPQGEALTYTVTGLPAGLSFNPTTLTISGSSVIQSGFAVKVTAKDLSGLSASETFQAAIVASAPTVRQTPLQTWTANKGVSLSVASAFTDPQGESFTYAARLSNGAALPAGLTFNTATGSFDGIAPTAPGTLAITVTAKDQSGLSSQETFQAIVKAVAPTVANQTGALTWAAGKPISFTLPANTFADPQGEKLTLSATLADGSALPGGLTFNASSGTLSGTAPITPETLGLKITATDASGLAISEQFSATVQAAAPTLAQQTASQIWTAGSSMGFLLPSHAFADPQGAALSYAAFQTSGPDATAWLHFTASLADFTGHVPTGLSGTIGIKVVATDAFGLSASESFGVTFAASGAHPFAAGAPTGTEMFALRG